MSVREGEHDLCRIVPQKKKPSLRRIYIAYGSRCVLDGD